MSHSRGPRMERLTTGVPSLDSILDGGFPTGSLNIIAGGPGSGKSTLALQILFHQARLGKQNIYFTSISEPAIKYLRYMQQYEFFDPDLVGKTVFFLDLSGPSLTEGLEATTEALLRQVQDKGPAVVAVDSFKALRSRLQSQEGAQPVLYDLAVNLAVSGVTTFLVGEYTPEDIDRLPEFFAADGIISLSTDTEGLAATRLLEVIKLRGSGFVAGRHFFDITSAGVTVYPRLGVPAEQPRPPEAAARLSTGVPGLDEMLGGGLPARTSTFLEGGTGTGKTTIALSFLVEGARRGEAGLMLALDETREQLFELAAGRGWDLPSLTQRGLLEIIYSSPMDLAADILLQRTRGQVERLGAKRVVIDSVTSLGLGLAAEGRVPGLIYSLVKTFRMLGSTAIFISETPELLGSATLTGRGLSSIADNIILLRYVEIESRLARAITVLKVRGSQHEHVLRELAITGDRLVIGAPFSQYRGVLTGAPTPSETALTRRRTGGSAPKMP